MILLCGVFKILLQSLIDVFYHMILNLFCLSVVAILKWDEGVRTTTCSAAYQCIWYGKFLLAVI